MVEKITIDALSAKSVTWSDSTALPWLYDLDSKGNLRQWQMRLSEKEGSYWTVSGLSTGKHVYGKPTFVDVMNVGRSNERGIVEQVWEKARSIYQKKLDSGYSLDKDLAGSILEFECMLAHSFKDKKMTDALKHPILAVQPKLDGHRCNIKSDGSWTRNRKKYATTQHIENAFAMLLEDHPDLIFDGELYNHSLKDNFDSISSLVRKTKPTANDVAVCSDMIQFHIYDMFDPLNPEMSFLDRFAKLNSLLQEYRLIDWYDEKSDATVVVNTPIRVVDCVILREPKTFSDMINVIDANNVANGYEGSMVRLALSAYEQKRSNTLLKVKTFIDEEFIIHDIIEGNGAWAGCAKSVRYIHPNGNVFDTGLMGTMERSKQILIDKEKYIGKPATVKYQSLTEASGVPRFGVTKYIWDTEKT